MRRICRGCTIVALDVLDQRGVARYIRRWYRALSRSLRSRARLVGIHNYSDTNRLRSRGTRSIIRTVKRYSRHARFWMTETGGVVNFGRSFPVQPAARGEGGGLHVHAGAALSARRQARFRIQLDGRGVPWVRVRCWVDGARRRAAPGVLRVQAAVGGVSAVRRRLLRLPRGGLRRFAARATR
jgi:hypothetical protein